MVDQVIHVAEGEFAGWSTWAAQDEFEALVGPFFFVEEHSRIRCAFRATGKQMNSNATMHGGCMLAFADFALFALSSRARLGRNAVR